MFRKFHCETTAFAFGMLGTGFLPHVKQGMSCVVMLPVPLPRQICFLKRFKSASVVLSFGFAHASLPCEVPSDFGTGHAGIVVGSNPNSNSINMEVHRNGKPRLWWNGGSANWLVDSDVRIEMREGVHCKTQRHAHLCLTNRSYRFEVYVSGTSQFSQSKLSTTRIMCGFCKVAHD